VYPYSQTITLARLEQLTRAENWSSEHELGKIGGGLLAFALAVGVETCGPFIRRVRGYAWGLVVVRQGGWVNKGLGDQVGRMGMGVRDL
jgi:hypothetical protein